MNVKAAIRQVLLADTAVKAIVKTIVVENKLPQAGSYPCALINTITENDDITLNSAPALRWVRVQITCYASSGIVRDSLKEAIMTALTLNTFTVTGCNIESATPLIGGSNEQYSPEIEMHFCSKDYGIWYKYT